MGSDETAITIPGGPRVIDVFYGNGAPSGPNKILFPWVDRRSDVSRGRSGGGSGLCRVHPRLELSSGLDQKHWGLGLELRAVLRTCTDMYRLMEEVAQAV